MLLVACVISILVACVALSAALCFVKKQSPFYAALKGFFFASLVCLGICCASYRNTFNGCSILLFLSVLPLIFTLFELKPGSAFSVEENDATELEKSEQETQNFDTENGEKTSKKRKKRAIFAPNWTKIMNGMAYAVSAFCVAFCALYFGKESFYVFLVGLAIGLALTFLHFLIKKRGLLSDPWGFCADFLHSLAVGFLLSAILPALLYSFALDNILFSVACFTYAAHLLLETYLPNKFNHLALTAAYLLLFATIVF